MAQSAVPERSTAPQGEAKAKLAFIMFHPSSHLRVSWPILQFFTPSIFLLKSERERVKDPRSLQRWSCTEERKVPWQEPCCLSWEKCIKVPCLTSLRQGHLESFPTWQGPVGMRTGTTVSILWRWSHDSCLITRLSKDMID